MSLAQRPAHDKYSVNIIYYKHLPFLHKDVYCATVWQKMQASIVWSYLCFLEITFIFVCICLDLQEKKKEKTCQSVASTEQEGSNLFLYSFHLSNMKCFIL